MLMTEPVNRAQQLYCLEKITGLPLPLSVALYRHYPGMKLGQMPLVDFFSRELALLAADIMRNDVAPSGPGWVITAPAYYSLPSAANLLARQVCKLLLQWGHRVDLIEPRLNQQQIAVSNLAEFRQSNDYSKNPSQTRMAERQRVHALAGKDTQMSAFRHRRVMIINDIHVTGTQQKFMQAAMQDASASETHWLYIFHVEQGLAQQHPEIEFQINSNGITGLDSFAAILADEQTQYTTRCLARLFSEEIEDYRYLIGALQAGTREKILQLAQAEGRYNHSIFAEKMQLLSARHVQMAEKQTMEKEEG
ncbi:phosphoribosyltransferase family protein [Undibacterium sp. TJN19]|uniref:phosphoribosyltransferase family protein n=1 Tax=Undibacterium sp. TJN19 TaxID=3413055 RepID=UPI003BEFA09B